MKLKIENREKGNIPSHADLHPFHWIRYFFLMILFWSGILSFFSVNALADDASGNDGTVRIGYYLSQGFQEGNSDHSFKSGYSYEYLQKIATYTGWHYEYVYGNWDDLYDKLIHGEIDLMAGISYSDDRAKQICYPDYEMLNETFYIYKDTEDISIKCGDISSYDGKKIGTLKENRPMSDTLEKWKNKTHANIDIVTFDDLEACAAAFNEKEIDAFVSADNIVSSYSGIAPVEKIGKEPYYLCVTENRTDILNQLNLALSVINEQDALDLDELKNKYSTETTVSVFLSKQERDWMDSHPSVTVGYVNSYLPYSDTTKKGEVTGLVADTIPDLFASLPGNYAPDIHYRSFDSQQDMIESVKKGEIDFAFPVSDERWYSEQQGYQQSTATVASPISLVYKDPYNNTTTEKIAINKNNLLQYCYTIVKYPEAELIMCDTIEDCIKAVKKGSANSTLVSALRANSLVGNEKRLNLLTLPEDEKLCFGVAYGNTALLQILNHGINILGDSYGLNHTYRYIDELITYTLSDFVNDNLWFFTSLLLLLSSGIIFYLIQREQKQKEMAVKEAAQKKALEEALVSSQQANVARRIFLRNMSHDIRTPMNAVIGFTNLALQSCNDSLKVKDYLSKILISSKHLLGIVNDVLEISRIESGQVSLEEAPCNLLDIVNETDIIIRNRAQEKGQHFVVDVSQIQDSFVLCDKLKVKEILVNLLGNAVKYTPPGGNISLTIRQISSPYKDYGNYEICVKDNGCGMSSEFLKKVFLPFERQADSTTSKVQGTGLGMAITKGFIDLMNGSIDIVSEENKGTEVIVHLQHHLGTPAPGKEMLPDIPEKDLTFTESSALEKHILLAEDNELNREIAIAILTDSGFKVDVAENGAIAVDKVKMATAGFYDAILMDIQMPVMDGYMATKQIRLLSDKLGDKIPIFALSANAFEEDKKASFEAGMNGHLAKPINITELLETLSLVHTDNI